MSPLCTCVFWFKISGSSSLQKEMPTPQDSGEFSQRLTLRGLHSLAGIGESWRKSRPAILLLWNWLQMEARQGVQSLLVPDTDRTWSAHHPRPVIPQCRVAALLRVWAGLTVQGGQGLSVARKRLFWMQWLSAGLWVWGKARRLGSGGEVAGKRRGASRLGHRDDTHLRTFSSFSFQRPALPWKRRTMESSVLFPGLPNTPQSHDSQVCTPWEHGSPWVAMWPAWGWRSWAAADPDGMLTESPWPLQTGGVSFAHSKAPTPHWLVWNGPLPPSQWDRLRLQAGGMGVLWLTAPPSTGQGDRALWALQGATQLPISVLAGGAN